MQIKITWSWYWSFQLKSNPGTRCLFQSKPSLLSSMAIYFFLSSWAGGILQILQSDWFWEWAVFLPSGLLIAGGIQKNVSKFSWKPFKSLFNIITQINVLMKLLSFICIAPVFSTVYSLTNCSVYGESCPNYSPLSFRFFSQKNKNVIHQPRSVHIGKNCALCLVY